MPRFIHLIVTATLIMAGGPVAAQTTAKVRHARFLAVGDSPPFRQVIRDGVRHELEPPPGTIPPREVMTGSAEEHSNPVSLRLGRISPRVEVPAGAGPFQIWRAGDAADDAPWLTIKRPAAGDFLVVLWRGPAAESWDDASAMALAETPAGKARIVNLYPHAVNIEWGGGNLLLPARRSLLRPVPPDAAVPLRILARNAEGVISRYYSGVVSANERERCLVAIHRADGVMPRRPLKVSVLREPADAPVDR